MQLSKALFLFSNKASPIHFTPLIQFIPRRKLIFLFVEPHLAETQSKLNNSRSLREPKDLKINGGYSMETNNQKEFTKAGTDIIEVKRQNADSGLTYNEMKELIAKTGGVGTAAYSDTDVNEVRRQNQLSQE